jgi:hypothetical protein
MRFMRIYDYKRALYGYAKLIQPWFELVRDTVAKYGILGDWLYDRHDLNHYGCYKLR